MEVLEQAYKQFKLGDLPIYQDTQRISIRKLFRILTSTELENLPTVEAMNFYLYCNFFKNRLLYSEIFIKNLAYIHSKHSDLKQRIKHALSEYDQMLKGVKSESDSTWIENNIAILNDGLLMLDSVPQRCDYYDRKLAEYLERSNTTVDNFAMSAIEAECAAEFASLAQLFSDVGRLIGRN